MRFGQSPYDQTARQADAEQAREEVALIIEQQAKLDAARVDGGPRRIVPALN